jgi:hypothetical protein
MSAAGAVATAAVTFLIDAVGWFRDGWLFAP